MLARIHLVTLKRFTRLLVLVMVIQMFVSGEPAESKKAARKTQVEEIQKASVVKF